VGWRSGPGGDGQASFPPELVVAVKAIACELPSRLGQPLSRLQVPDIRSEVIGRGLVAEISGTTIWRWLAEDAIRPWAHRSWIFPRAPDFEPKAARVLDLYARQWQGEPLAEDDYVVSADEKTSIQARCRCHPTLPPARSRAMRVEHEYERGGSLAYFAAWDVHQAKLFGRLEPSTGIQPFKRLVAQMMGSEPYASARRVFWVVDNGSSHRGAASVRRLAADWPRAQLVHTPIHSSWLNQVEIYLSIVQRKCLTSNDFASLGAVQERLLAFQRRYEQTAKPFQWKFTRADLAQLLKRLAAKDDLPPAA
jgi:DDE superfamily endonuclease